MTRFWYDRDPLYWLPTLHCSCIMDTCPQQKRGCAGWQKDPGLWLPLSARHGAGAESALPAGARLQEDVVRLAEGAAAAERAQALA